MFLLLWTDLLTTLCVLVWSEFVPCSCYSGLTCWQHSVFWFDLSLCHVLATLDWLADNTLCSGLIWVCAMFLLLWTDLLTTLCVLVWSEFVPCSCYSGLTCWQHSVFWFDLSLCHVPATLDWLADNTLCSGLIWVCAMFLLLWTDLLTTLCVLVWSEFAPCSCYSGLTCWQHSVFWFDLSLCHVLATLDWLADNTLCSGLIWVCAMFLLLWTDLLTTLCVLVWSEFVPCSCYSGLTSWQRSVQPELVQSVDGTKH